jgi:hypothetical protein
MKFERPHSLPTIRDAAILHLEWCRLLPSDMAPYLCPGDHLQGGFDANLSVRMSKIIHVVKEARGGYQVRASEPAGEGAGAGEIVECKDLGEVTAALRARGCSDERISQLAEELKESDNAEIRT